ncbi:MAG TPA: hypothetical protein VFL15_09780 [Gammaproteobacteria bacterium]|nr:hypothetical protein [Gammaproteobacteria bacterium]
MNSDLIARIQPYLQKDESIQWVGAPDRAAIMMDTAKWLPLNLVVLAVFAGIGHRFYPAQFDFHHFWPFSPHDVIAYLFVLLALGALGKLLRLALFPPRVTYAVTNLRALILQGGHLWAYTPDIIPGISHCTRIDKRKDLMFLKPNDPGKAVQVTLQRDTEALAQRSGTLYGAAYSPNGFRGISDVATVHAALQRLLESAAQPATP